MRAASRSASPTSKPKRTASEDSNPQWSSACSKTPAYARELLSLPGSPLAYAESEAALDEVVAQRMSRQQVLYQPGKLVQLIMGEAALRTSVGTIGTLLGQLDRLMTMTALPSVDVGIVPFTVPMLPVPGFVLYDDDVVTAESLTAEQRLIEPNEVAQYINFFDHLHADAATGPDAAALIHQAAAELQGRRPENIQTRADNK